MGNELDRDQKMESFIAVGDFLVYGKKSKTSRSKFTCSITVLNPVRQSFEQKIEFEIIDSQQSYVLYSDAFKSLGYYKPIWSAYSLFTWNEEKAELSVKLNEKNIIIQHI